MTALQPILWLILYSAIASSTMQHSGIENYTAFMLPGLIVLISFSTCSSSGIMNYLMKSDGSFDRILIAPLTRSSIVLAQLPNEVIYETVMNAIVLPVFFLSNALFPMTGITGFLHTAINLNPFTHMIQALRSLILYGRIDTGNLTAVLLLFILMGSLSFLWACRQLEKKTNNL